MSTVDPKHARALVEGHARRRLGGAPRWVDGTPLGNGRVGAVVWGAAEPLTITVDHAEFWDRRRTELSRPATFADFADELAGRPSEWPSEWPVHAPKFDIVTPTRLPPSRLRMHGLGATVRTEHDLWGAHLCVVTERAEMTITVLGEHDVVVVEGRGAVPQVDCQWLADPAICELRAGGQPMLAPHPASLFADHAAPLRVALDNGERIGHAVPDGSAVGLCWRLHDDAQRWSLLVALTAERRGTAASVLDRTAELLDLVDADRAAALGAHAQRWHDFHTRSWVSVPESDVEALWYAELAKLGSAVRADGPPLGLQGPWSPDGRMPPWGGDLHHNVNVQMSYAPVCVTGHAELGESLQRYASASFAEWTASARELFDVDGMFVTSATDDEGRCRHEYALVNLAWSSGPWLAQVLYGHWAHTGDERLLHEVLVPLLRGVGEVVASQLQHGEDGRLHVPLGYSPELVPLGGPAWGPDPTIDLALFDWLFRTNAQLADMAGDIATRDRWSDLAMRLAAPSADAGFGAVGGVVTGTTGGFRVRADLSLDRSHRHHSHLVAVHPLRTATADSNDPAVRQLVSASQQQLMLRGPGEWVGFSVPWAASIAAHSGFADVALGHLRDYAQRWVGPSTFHVQASATGQVPTVWNELGGYMGGDALSLEAGFGFAAAVVDLLLQDHDGVVRVCPALPQTWNSIAYAGLRAAGGFEVSARTHDSCVVLACIEAHRPGELVVRFTSPDGPLEHRAWLETGEQWTFAADGWRMDQLTPAQFPD